MTQPFHYKNLPEPPNLGIRPVDSLEKLRFTVYIEGREVEVISLRWDTAVPPPQMPTWLFLRVSPSLTILLHTCGDGSGWHEVDEGTPHFTVRSDNASQGYMLFNCLRCTSAHRMRADGTIEWTEMAVDDQIT